jgi:hypothetical protein
VLAFGQFPVGEQAQPLLEAEGLDLGEALLLGQGFDHAGQLQGPEFIQGGMGQHEADSEGG